MRWLALLGLLACDRAPTDVSWRRVTVLDCVLRHGRVECVVRYCEARPLHGDWELRNCTEAPR